MVGRSSASGPTIRCASSSSGGQKSPRIETPFRQWTGRPTCLGGHGMKRVVTTFLGAALLLSSTSLTFAAKEGELLVWVGTNRDEAALQTILDKFTADLGISAKVEVVDPVPDK